MASTGPCQVANIFLVCGAQENFILDIIKLLNVTTTSQPKRGAGKRVKISTNMKCQIAQNSPQATIHTPKIAPAQGEL